jgi:hypothetical protein
MQGNTYNDTGIDRSVAILFFGLALAGLFCLLVIGLQRAHQTARTPAIPLEEAAQPAPLVDFAD